MNTSFWKESLTWIVPRIRIVRGENLEGWRTGCRPWGAGDDGRIGNLLKKTQCERGDISQRKRRIYFSNRRGTNQNPWRRSGPENIHLGTSSTNSRRKSPWFSWRIRRVSSTTSRLVSGCRWSDKWLLVHVGKLYIPPSRWTQSQSLLAKRRIIHHSTETHWCIQNYSYEFGCQAREAHWWLLEHWWLSRLVWSLDRFHTVYCIGRKTSKRIFVVREEINEKTADIQARSFMARTLGAKWERMPSWRRGKKGSHKKLHHDNARKLRGIYFIDPEDKEFKETIKNARKKLEASVAPAMPCKIMKNCGSGGSDKNKTKLACILEANESTRMRMGNSEPPNHEDHIAGKETIHYSIIIWFTNLFLCLKPWKFPQQRQQWTRNWENWRNFRRGTWRKSEVRKRWSMKQGRRAQKFISPHW